MLIDNRTKRSTASATGDKPARAAADAANKATLSAAVAEGVARSNAAGQNKRFTARDREKAHAEAETGRSGKEAKGDRAILLGAVAARNSNRRG